MRALAFRTCILAAGVSLVLCAGDTSAGNPGDWSGKSAAAYLDGRMAWWIDWPTAARDHQTFCVSCHTVVPYAMGRPALRAALSEQAPSANERRLIGNVAKRVRMWAEVEPFYPDAQRGVPKTAESRGTESVLNAVILVGYDAGYAAGGTVPAARLSADTRLALANMWALQLAAGDDKGAWQWLQFHNAPWEGDSQYYGAALAAIAVGTAPENYRASPEIQRNLEMLREYLRREGPSQVLINRVMLLWASTKIPGLLTSAEQKSIMDEALGKQQADGGFSLSSFVGAWKRADGTPLETRSDGYATGIVSLVLEQAGVGREQPALKRGLAWLAANQNQAEGRWLAYSLNKQRDLSSSVGRFMSDAATAYAVMALKPTN